MRLMTINRNGDKVEHTCFDGIREFLRPGDLFVFNTSRTFLASFDGCDVTTG
ncbi:MAG: S-adenosylmethionine:tRNA ribosyltransferase-isomerase [Rhizonema sp. PD38]|nr:S-adenosylmethionine:tRNA ribosyltransferase-isomerase [Rhizonema sp. PD38]